MKTLCLWALILVPVLAQEPPKPEGAKPEGGRRERPAPKNLKILQPDQVMGAMRAFRGALGVECTYCHVQGDFASDDNPKKNVAREMLEMSHQINGHFPDGKMHVTCYTCHRGATEPATAPPAGSAPAGGPPPPRN